MRVVLPLLWVAGALASVRISVPSSDVTVDGQRVFLSGIQPSSFTACFKPRFSIDQPCDVGVEIECSGPPGSVMTTTAFLEEHHIIDQPSRLSSTSHLLSDLPCHFYTPISRVDKEQIYRAVCVKVDGSPLITCDLRTVVLTISQPSTSVAETPESTPGLNRDSAQRMFEDYLEQDKFSMVHPQPARSDADSQLNSRLSSGQLFVDTDQLNTDDMSQDRETASADRVRVLVTDLDDDYYADIFVHEGKEVAREARETSSTPTVDW